MPVLLLLLLPVSVIWAQKNPAWPWRSAGPAYSKMSGKDKREADKAAQEALPKPKRSCSLPPDKPAKPLPMVMDGRINEAEFLEPWPAEPERKLRLRDLKPQDAVTVLFPQRRRWGATYKNPSFAVGTPTAIWGPEENYTPSAEKRLSIVNGEIALSECEDGKMSEPLGVFPPLPASADERPPKGVLPRCEGTCKFLEPVMHDGDFKYVLVEHGRLKQRWWIGLSTEPGIASLVRLEAPCVTSYRKDPVDFEFELGTLPPADTLPGLRPQGWSYTCHGKEWTFGTSLGTVRTGRF